MKKNKTTKSSKKSYSSVKEVLEDNNSKIKLTPFNCKEAKFGKIIEIENPYSSTGKFDFIFRRASTSERFFSSVEDQRPNQILWNEEEKQAYFLNPDKQLYKILFEPVAIEKQCSKRQIKNIAVRWSEFFDENAKWYNEKYKTYLLTSIFVDLLDIVKQKSIKVKCGIAMMELIEGYVYYEHCSPNKSIHIGGCEIIPELDFNLAKYDLWYEDVCLDICLVGTSVPEKDANITQDANELFKKVAEKVCPPKKKKSLLERIFG